jgi:hypothetical protein
MTDKKIDAIAAAISQLPVNVQEQVFEDLYELKMAKRREEAQASFSKFVKAMWPGFIDGRHHKVMAKKFEEIASGKLKRLIINMPPRHTKSEFASFMLPSWFLGLYPGKKIIQSSNTSELAVGFGRKVRNLVDSEAYSQIFPNVALRADSKAAGRWATNGNGEYFAIGVGGTVTGKGADLLIIDDPHSEQEAKLAQSNPEIFDQVYEWYTSGPRQRLQPGGAIVVVMTRWSKKDLTGRILQLPGHPSERQPVVARVLEPGRIGSAAPGTASEQVERPVPAKPNVRRGRDRQARVVEDLEIRQAPALRVCHSVLGYSVHQE